MARMRTYRCPSCAGTFEFMHHPTDEPPPRFCPLCGFDTEAEELGETLALPSLRSIKTQRNDDLMRATQEGAEHRARIAEEVHGFSAEEASAIKMHDMKTTVYEGENAAVPVVNDVSRAMAAAPNGAFGFGGGAAQGIQFSSAVSSGPHPNAGMRAVMKVRNNHRGAQSSNPALETMNPNYRPRV